MTVKLEIIERLVRAKALLTDHPIDPDELPATVNDWPEDWRDEYEERAGIMEFDGNLSRQEAEQWAETIVRAAFKVRQK